MAKKVAKKATKKAAKKTSKKPVEKAVKGQPTELADPDPLTKLIDDCLAGPRLLRQAVAGMDSEQLLARPIAGEWSTLEVICHLADFEIVGADRIKRVIAEKGPTLLGGDEKAFAARLLEVSACVRHRRAGRRLAGSGSGGPAVRVSCDPDQPRGRAMGEESLG